MTTVAVLFPETGSVTVVLTVAAFVRVPAVPGEVPVTVIVIGLAPLATVPRLQVIVLGGSKAKFDETIEIAINLGVDPRHADQMVRGVVTLPNGTGRTLRVGVFARGAKAEEAKAAGADVVGAEDLVEKSGRRDRFRPLYRHPRHDAAGRPAR